VTFASFNNPSKINDAVLGAWARILAAAPHARLQLGYQRHFSAPALQRRILGAFDQGLASRIDFLPAAPDATTHLSRLARSDVILDTFPFGGATSTFDALWMGVPVVTIAGDRFVGRVGVSLLSELDLTDLIAHDVDDYIARAVHLAADAPRRRHLRATLRNRLERSAFLDHAGQARAFESALREIWRRWCAGAPPTP
jgi:predicted O-linked N-acetylglucosamine transferase (SPINDLY family)